MEPSSGRSIAVLRALKLGDMLCAVPAFRALRRGRPHDRIVLIGLPWAETFVDRFPHLIDGFLPFPGWPGMPEGDPEPAVFERTLADIRRHRFDLAIQMHGDGSSSNAVVASFGARETGGFTSPGAARLDTERSLPYPNDLHEVHRPLALLERLGVPSAGEDLEFGVTERDRADLDALGFGFTRDYAVIHPGATSGGRWPPERFATLVDVFADEFDIVLTGTAAEREITTAVASEASASVVNAAGSTSLGALAALLAAARIVVTNDTGVSHLTAAVGTPSVVLFLSSDPRRWAPLDRARHRVVVHPAVARAHAAHPERAGALDEACLSGACTRHPDVRAADPSELPFETVMTEVRRVLDGVAARTLR